MGNCMQTYLPRSQRVQGELHGDQMETTTTYPQKHRPEAYEEEELQDGVINRGNNRNKEVSGNGKGDDRGSVRVKIVLKKEELHWLMMQLKSDGDKRLENMLGEIEMGREKVVSDYGGGEKCIGWKPSLESIMEIPELPEMDRSMRL